MTEVFLYSLDDENDYPGDYIGYMDHVNEFGGSMNTWKDKHSNEYLREGYRLFPKVVENPIIIFNWEE